MCVTNVSVGDKAGGVGAVGLCSDGAIGSRCDDNPDCANNRCFKGDNWSVCVAGKEWSGCDDQGDCELPDLKCDIASKRCVPK